jgi:hypothetical protein
VHGRVALEVVPLVARPEQAQRLPGGPAEAGIGRQRHGHVNVEDPLAEALERRVGHPVEREREPHEQEARSATRERDRAAIP